MPGYARGFRLWPLATLLCVGACLSTQGYYRYQDGGTPGEAGTTGNGGSGTGGSGGSSVAGATGTGGSTGGTAGTVATGRGGTTGAAGAAGGRGGTTGSAGSAGTTGRGGTTGSAGTTGSGGSGTILFMEDFESGVLMTPKWDTGAIPMSMTPIIMDGTKVLSFTSSTGDQLIAAAGMTNWTNYSLEAKVKVISFTGTSSSDGVSICVRLTGPSSFYYLQLSNGGDAKSLKIKVNNGNNSSLSSSLDSSPYVPPPPPVDFVTMRLDVQGNTLTAYLNGMMKGTPYTVPTTDPTKILPMGGIGLTVENTVAEFDDVIVRALP